MTDNIYSKVIFRQNDPESSEMVNSYRFKSSSPIKNRMWSPEISEEDRFRKKRLREDEYIQQLDNEVRPVLVIKKKQVFENLQSPEFGLDPATDDRYFKISKNTSPVHDLEEAISAQQGQARRETVVNRPKGQSHAPTEENQATMYKIQGVEFLPEGFLELDPLLYKDEYLFDNSTSEKLFDNEQRRLKALRRKQYEQRKDQKQREVTIFVMDEYRDKILDYFEKWYFDNKRRMDDEEIENVAQLLNSPPETIARLQDVYLKRMKLINDARVQELMMLPTAARNRKISQLPISLQKYFAGMKEFEEEIRKKKSTSPSLSKSHKGSSPIRPLSMKISQGNSLSASKLSREDGSFAKGFGDDTGSFNRSLSHSDYSARPTVELKRLYDEELNKIIGEIKERNSSNLEGLDRLRFSTAAQRGSAAPSAAQRSYSKSSGVETSNNNFNRSKVGSKASVPEEEGRPKTLTKNSRFNSKPTKLENYSEFVNPNHLSEIKQEQSQLLMSEVEPGLDGRADAWTGVDDPARVLSVYRAPGGSVLIRQTLRPTLIGSQYFFQVIDEFVDELGNRIINMITKNEEGEVVATHDIDPRLSGLYQNRVSEIGAGSQKKISVSVVNEKGQTVAVENHKPSMNVQIGSVRFDQVEQINDPRGRKTTVAYREDKEAKMSVVKLKPTLLGNQYYTQMVSNFANEAGTESILITRDGEGRLLSEVPIPVERIGSVYATEIVEEFVENGERKFTIETRNEDNELVARQTIRPTFFMNIGSNLFVDEIEEVVDSTGIRKVTVMNAIEGTKKPSVISQAIRPSMAFSQYPESIGKKSSTSAPKMTGYTDFLNEYCGALLDELDEEMEKNASSMASSNAQNFGRFSAREKKNTVQKTAKSHTVSGPPARPLKKFSLFSKPSSEHPVEKKTSSAKLSLTEERAKAKSKPTVTFQDDPKHKSSDGGSSYRKPTAFPIHKGSKAPSFSQEAEGSDEEPDELPERNKSSLSAATASFASRLTSHKNSPAASEVVVEKLPKDPFPRSKTTGARNPFSPASQSSKGFSQGEQQGSPWGKSSPFGSRQNTESSLLGVQKSDRKNSPIEVEVRQKTNNLVKSLSDSRFQGTEDDLLKDSIVLKNRLEEYIAALNESRANHRQNADDELRAKIKEVFEQEKDKLSQDLLHQLGGRPAGMLDEFDAFCRTRLNSDANYKESILLVSLFYYFLEKKKSEQERF